MCMHLVKNQDGMEWNKERGCLGKKRGYIEFHPRLCKDSFIKKCGKDYEKGFHLRNVFKKQKRYEDNDNKSKHKVRKLS